MYSGLKAVLRFASFALPSLATIMALVCCWRRHFVEQSILWAGFEMREAFMGPFFSIAEVVASRHDFSRPQPELIETRVRKIKGTLER